MSGYHHGDLKNALTAAAAQLLEQDGPEAISLRAVARQVGVSQTAPYNHFPDKQHLLVALAAEGFRELESTQHAAAKRGRSAHKKIVNIGCAYVAFAQQNPQLYRLMFGVGITDWRLHPDVEQAKAATYVPIKEALALVDAGEVESTAAWALVHGLALLLIDGALDESVVEKVVSHFADGLDR